MVNSIPSSQGLVIRGTYSAMKNKPLPFFEFQDYIRSLNFGMASLRSLFRELNLVEIDSKPLLEGEFFDTAPSPRFGPIFLAQAEFEDDEQQVSLYSTCSQDSTAFDQALEPGHTHFGLYKSFAHILFPEMQHADVPHKIDTLDHLKEIEIRVKALIKTIPARTRQERDLTMEKLLGPPHRDAGLSLLEITVYLYSNGLVQEQYPDPALEWAMKNTPFESLLALLQSPLPALQQIQYNFFRQGVATGRAHFVKRLLQLNPILLDISLSMEPECIIENAMKSGCIEILELLWNAGGPQVDGDTKRTWRRSLRSIDNSLSVAKFLASKGVDLSCLDNNSLLLTAAKSRDIALVRFLLDTGVDVNEFWIYGDQTSEACLRIAVSVGDLKLLNLLLDHKADVHAISKSISGLWGRHRADRARIHRKRYSADRIWSDDFTATAIQAAANKNEFEMVIMLHTFGASINEPPHGKDGITALYAAVDTMNLEMVGWLLERGADPNVLGTVSNEFPRTCLMNAVEEGHLKMVELLLEHGADPDTPGAGSTEFPCTALLAAVEDNNYEMVQLLLEFKANPNVPAFGYYGATLLDAAKALGNPSLVSCLMDAGALEPPTADRVDCRIMRNLLGQAIAANDSERISYLCERGARIDLEPLRNDNWGYSKDECARSVFIVGIIARIKSATMFHWASPLASDSFLDFLLSQWSKSGTQTAKSLASLFPEVIKWKRIGLVKLLLDRGGDINALSPCCNDTCSRYSRKAHDHTPLQHAIMSRKFEIVLLFLERGADVNFRHPDAPTALQSCLREYAWRASASSTYEIAGKLLERGAKVNTPPHDTTILFLAVIHARHGDFADTRMVQTILKLKSSYHDPAFGFTEYIDAFILAASFSSTVLLKVLIEYVIDIDMPASWDDLTALQVAAEKGHINTAQFLLENGANVNDSGRHECEWTALECACVHGRLDMVQFLLNHDADLHLPANQRYETALRLAEGHGHLGIVKLLQGYREEALEEWNESRIDSLDTEDVDTEEEYFDDGL